MFTASENIVRFGSSLRHFADPREHLSRRALLWALLQCQSHLKRRKIPCSHV